MTSSPMDSVAKWLTFSNAAYIVACLFAVFATFGIVYFSRRYTHLKEAELEQYKHEADARIAEAGHEAAKANAAAAQANERTQRVEGDNLVLRGTLAGVEVELAKQRTRAAEAERLLAQVNERTKDRHLSLEQCDTLISALMGKPSGDVTVRCAGTGPEPRIFGREIVACLQKSGWRVNDRTADIALGLQLKGGSILFVQDKNAPPLRAGALQAALHSVGIEAFGENGEAGTNKDDVTLFIGEK